VVSLLVATIDLRGAIGFSSFGVLVYYGVANACAATQAPPWRRWPRALNLLGLAGCLLLVATLPPSAVVIGCLVLALGAAGRALLARPIA
jgi:APA family basic amino acid/polyamine antiporter